MIFTVFKYRIKIIYIIYITYKNSIQLTMLLHGEGLLKVAHEVTTNVMYLRPLFEHKHYAQHNERGC